MRVDFYERLKVHKLDPKVEYKRIYELFNENVLPHESICDMVSSSIELFPKSFRGRALSIEDFDETYGFDFSSINVFCDEDNLICYCEYVINLCEMLTEHGTILLNETWDYAIERLKEIVYSCMEEMHLMPVKKEEIIIFVQKDQAVTSVSELINKGLSYHLLEYNHHSLKGNLEKKKIILKLLADDIEPQRGLLNNINKSLSSKLFQMLQKFVRHNNDENEFIKNLSNEETEVYYDDIYQMWLLAKLEIDNLERKERVKLALQQINA